MAKQRIKGFTLIELVMVIVILGVLAAFAIPRHVSLNTEARISMLNGLQGSVTSAAQIAFMKCIASPGCYGQTAPITGPDGTTIGILLNGYPTGKSRTPSWFGLKDWLTVQGNVTLYEIDNSNAEIWIDGAPTPANCKVHYTEAGTMGSLPTIFIVTSGC